MSSESIVAIIVAFIGGSGLTTLIQVLFNRNKTKAEIDALKADAVSGSLSSFTEAADKIVQASDRTLEMYGKALDIANLEIKALSDRVSGLEAEIEKMKDESLRKDTIIETLQRENSELRKELSNLEDRLKYRDKVIADLRKRISELESRLRELGQE